MRLHEELNYVDNNISLPQKQVNKYDKNQVFQCYINKFQKNFKSIISSCFYGTIQGELECLNCKMKLFQMGQNIPNIKYNYHIIFL